MAPRKRRRRLYRRAADWLLQHQGTPYSLAMGFSVGIFVAMTPTVGFQMVLGAFVAHLLRANRTLPVVLAWISNPFTMGPLYYFNYRVGLLFLPGDEQAGRAFIDAMSSASLADPEALWQVLVRMAEELWGVAGVLWAGSLVVATVASAVCYPVVWRIVKIEQRKLERVRKQISLRPPPLDAEAEQAPASSSDSEACQRS